MLSGNTLNKLFLFIVAGLSAGSAAAQVSWMDEDRRGSVYVAIGNNTATPKASTIEIAQGNPGSSRNFTLDMVEADSKTNSKSTGIPFNLKIGYFFDYEQNYAIELSYEPVKYHVTDGQNVKMKGTAESAVIDTSFVFSAANGYFYNLDGSNMIAINFVRRFQLLINKRHSVRLDALAKAGGGPVMPHVFNSIDGKVAEYPSFQLGGWNAGLEAALRVTLFRHVFLEGGYRYAHASYNDVGVYNGTAKQKMNVSMVLISGGITFSTTKRNPLFVKPDLKPAPRTIIPIHPEPLDTRE
jgi:hypothetical protein